MATFSRELDDDLIAFIGEQEIFFVASAPRDGRINLSPKGGDTLRCLDRKTVGYLDLTGSGNETAAHIRETGRLTMMFCSFAKQPMILRLYGQGRVIGKRQDAWESFYARFEELPGARQIILLGIESVQTSCGFAVPYYEFLARRDTLTRLAESKGEAGLEKYRREKNLISIDGKPTGLDSG